MAQGWGDGVSTNPGSLLRQWEPRTCPPGASVYSSKPAAVAMTRSAPSAAVQKKPTSGAPRRAGLATSMLPLPMSTTSRNAGVRCSASAAPSGDARTALTCAPRRLAWKRAPRTAGACRSTSTENSCFHVALSTGMRCSAAGHAATPRTLLRQALWPLA